MVKVGAFLSVVPAFGGPNRESQVGGRFLTETVMAKRVNTRFLIVLTAVFACLIAAGVVAKVTVFRKDPKAFEAAGDKEFKEGNYKKAIEYYHAAVAASKNAPIDAGTSQPLILRQGRHIFCYGGPHAVAVRLRPRMRAAHRCGGKQ